MLSRANKNKTEMGWVGGEGGILFGTAFWACVNQKPSANDAPINCFAMPSFSTTGPGFIGQVLFN